MTAQNKPLPQQAAKKKISAQMQADYEFRKKNSLFKIWIALPDGQTKTHYATDCSATIAQMVMKHVATVTLSPAKGLQDCRNKEKYFGKKQDGYRTCIIYRRTADGWEDYEKYVNGNLTEQSTEQPGPEQYYKCFVAEDKKSIELVFVKHPLLCK